MKFRFPFWKYRKTPEMRQRSIEEIAEMLTSRSPDDSGIISPERSLETAAVFRCVNIITNGVSNLPLLVKDGQENLTDRLNSILRRPNEWQTGYEFRKLMTARVLAYGNAYARIIRSRGEIKSLIPIEPKQIEVKLNDDMKVEYWYNGKFRIQLPSDDIFHLKNLSLDGIKGVSVLTYARYAIDMSVNAETFGGALFRNKLQPGAILTMPENKQMDEKKLTKLQNSFSNLTGPSKQHWTVILEDGMQWKPFSMTANDAQFVESRKFQRSEIAMFFGIPPFMLGDTEKSTSWGAGIEQQHLGFLAHTLRDYINMWEDRLENLWDWNYDFQHDLKDLLRGDSNARWTAHVKGLQWGVVSPNEVRRAENLEPRVGGDIYYPPPNQGGTPEGGDEPPANDGDDGDDEI